MSTTWYFLTKLVDKKFRLPQFILLDKALTDIDNVIGREFTAHYSDMLCNKQKK